MKSRTAAKRPVRKVRSRKKKTSRVEKKQTASRPNVEIAFYRANDRPYGAFSNLYKRSVVFEGSEFPKAEHAYQAGKPVRREVREWLLSAPTPALLAMAAHGLFTWDIRPDWSH